MPTYVNIDGTTMKYYSQKSDGTYYFSGTKKIGQIIRVETEEGKGYKIMMTDANKWCILYDNQQDYLELWFDEENMSGSDSLGRVSDEEVIQKILQD